MASEDIKEALKSAAIKIRDEKQAGANTALRVGSLLLAICEALNLAPEGLDEKYLRKDQPDTASEIITFLKGLVIGENGSGVSLLEDGTTQAVVDRLYVKMKAVFDSLEIKRKTFVGGEQILSPAGMKCIRVETLQNVYRCYMKAEEDGIQIEHEFVEGQLAICQECNIKVGVAQHQGNRFYWREVVAVGPDYIDLSMTVCAADSDIPDVGDDIVALGHRDDIVRQSAIILSAVAETAPSIIFYQGIEDFTLVGKEVIALEYDRSSGHARVRIYGDAYIGAKDRSSYMEYTRDKGVDVKGTFHIESGSTGWQNLEGLPDDIQAAADAAAKAQESIDNAMVGTVNLLRNTGFTGNYTTEELHAESLLNSESEMYSQCLKYWTGVAAVVNDSLSASGHSVSVGSLSQTVSLIKGENYVISFKARGERLAISCGDYNVAQDLSTDYQRYTYKFVFGGSGIFLISGTAEVCEIQLERGTIATDWHPSILDNDKTLAEFQSLSYLMDAIKNGSVDILGGLILSSMVQLGNYKDGMLQKVNAGISGIYNSDDDVAFWSGGSLEEAIRTIMKLKYDKKNPPTDNEWGDMANFVATHGGDLFLRGYIYALGGLFRGTVDIERNGYRIKIEPSSTNGCPCISIIDRNGVELLDISMQDLGNERIPYVNLYSPDLKAQTSLSYYGLVTREEFKDGYRQTEIGPGHIMITDGLKILWEVKHLPD